MDRWSKQVSQHAPKSPLLLRRGYGRSHGHHGELFQGQIGYRAGCRHRCLISLPCPSLLSKVEINLDSTTSLRVEPSHKLKVRRVVEATFSSLGIDGVGGVVTVAGNIEEGKGYGSSTSDCIAAAKAAAGCAKIRLSEMEIARLVVAAETASDNVMFRNAVLFAQREALVLENYGTPFPELEIVGVDTDVRAHVDTLSFPPAEYHWRHMETFEVLAKALRRAFATRDLELLGRVATASSIINQTFLPKKMFSELEQLTRQAGILGLAVAHTGTLVSFLLRPDDPALKAKIDLLKDKLGSLGLNDVLCFRTAQMRPTRITAA